MFRIFVTVSIHQKSVNRAVFVFMCSSIKPRVSQKQIMSHHFGFGNIQVDKVGARSIRNKATSLEASGKFQEKLMLRQRALEELMMENRLKKLLTEEDRLVKQMNMALKNSDFADEVSSRRQTDFNIRNNWLTGRENRRMASLEQNTRRKDDTRRSI